MPERFLVWVGGLRHPDPGKHVVKLAAAARKLPLVLVGSTRPWAHELPDVILTGQVSDEQLAAIYSAAHALVLSSANEGFGLTAVEALACGTPVAACDAPALREVLGERATFVAPGDMDGLNGPARPRGGRRPRRPRGVGRTRRAPRGACTRARRPPPRGRARPRASVGAPPREHGGDRLQQDRQIERERPVLEVDEVEVHEVVEVQLRAP